MPVLPSHLPTSQLNALSVQEVSETELHRRAEEEIRQQRALDTLGIRSAVRGKPKRKTDEKEMLEWNDVVQNQELKPRTRTLHDHANIFE
ncbi:MAG: hypothetical protein V2I33_20455 [Kangiellaceae bacterium]|jgi:hypothetical protein|nr:hypothetical protein [Kangiellaceae bacterium]